MCGRYSITKPVEAMRQLFDFAGPLPNLPARYNVAPTQEVPIIRSQGGDGDGGGGRALAMLRWGLIPFWAKEPSIAYRMINARAETVATKPAFRAAFRARRCLVPADGFYEWQKRGRAKQPFRIVLKGEALFAFAGLWERWSGGEGEVIESCTIIVTEANELLRPIHDRMPVILDPADLGAWLDGSQAEA